MRPHRSAPARRSSAFTLVEVMTTLALLGLVISSVFMCQYYGLQLYGFVRPKLDNAAYARDSLSRLIEEVRCAQYLEVGQGTAGTFTAAGVTNALRGNAIRIRPASNTNQFVYYYRDASANKLMKMALGSTVPVTQVQNVTNTVLFTLEDFAGNVLTNVQNNMTMGLFLQMRQDSARKNVGDSYQVRTKATRRAIL